MSRSPCSAVGASFCLGLLVLSSCADNPSEPDPPDPGDVDIVATKIAEGIDAPMYLTAPSNDERLFVVEQQGRIRIIQNGQLLPTPFLDIRSSVGSGGERGLLSMAFHPDYAANGFFYVNYTGKDGNTRVERYRVSAADPNVADPATAQLVLGVEQPFSNHNGGLIEFGPDGMLYIGMGDGGSGGDPLEHGQNPNTLLGTLLRIDVDGATPYGIPANNPWASGTGGRPEVWAIGLRNPWRFSFDHDAGMLYIADVGQNRREEIDAVPANQAGLNFGWNTMEGSLCYDPMSGCNRNGLVLPVHEYVNGADGSCSVTGGYVYRGTAIPALEGHYFYGDYCAGFVRSFALAGGVATDHQAWDLGVLGNITSFGEDAAGELYMLVQQGDVYRISPAD